MGKLDIKKLGEAVDKFLDGLTKEDIEDIQDKYFKSLNIPKGWVSIEDHLPRWLAEDVTQGYTEYKVRDKDGNEFIEGVTDHTMWYYDMKDIGVTHWFNDKDL